MGRYTTGGVGRDLIAGALAGAAAVWVTDKLDWSLYRAGGAQGIRKTEAARPGGMDPAHALAARAAAAVGVDIGNRKDNPTGHVFHYGMAVGMGALYGLLRGMSPAVSTGRGALYGLATFILKDEIGNTVMGTAGSPLDYPVKDHARGAAAHTLFGVVTDLGTRLLAPWRDEVVVERGPPLSERIEQGRHYLEHGRDYVASQGRQYLDQGRQYLDQGRHYASQLAEEARSRLPDVDAAELAQRGQRQARRFATEARSRVPDVDAAEIARAGRHHARRFAHDVRSRMPDVDAADLARAGQRQARRFAEDARSHLPEMPTTGLSRAMRWLFG
jgi:hypothetical protein